MQSLVQGECGQPNALVSLSSTIVRGSSNAPSTSGLSNFSFRPSLGNELAQEFLTEVANSTPAPTTFDLTELQKQISRIPDRPPVESSFKSKKWADEFALLKSQTADSSVADSWSNEFAATSTSKLAAEWSSDFNRVLQAADMQTIWEQIEPEGSEVLSPTAWPSEYLSKFDQITARADTAANWVSEFMAEVNSQKGDNTSRYANADSYEDDDADVDAEGAVKEADLSFSMYTDYKFEENNPFASEENLTQKAAHHMNNGQLANAILCLEAAVQQNQSDSYAWYLLGICQAENEDDVRAICALRRSLELDPANGDALLALAVSLANESLENSALTQLEHWLYTHEFYKGVISTDETASANSEFLEQTRFNRVEQKFLAAARHQPREGDAVLQNAIGILYNLNNDYERASDALKAAVSIESENPRLWNRLGATLSNSGRPAEAVAALRQALALFPNYVRAKYNLGIACMRMQSYREAIEHFTSALELQQNCGAMDASAIWDTLRSAVMSSFPQNAPELLDAVYARDLARFKNIL